MKDYRLLFTLKGYDYPVLLELLNKSEKRVIKTEQIHSSIVFHCQSNRHKSKDFTIKADGIISKDCNSIIRTIHADCLPIYFLDIQNDVFALIHSGWQGTLNQIARHTLNDMVRYYKLNLEDIQVVIGPGIDFDNYQVGSEIYQKFRSKWNVDLKFFKADQEKDKYKLDLKQANKELLVQSGIPSKNIFISDLSTYNSPDLFHSYRRDGNSAGRMAAFIYKVRSNP